MNGFGFADFYMLNPAATIVSTLFSQPRETKQILGGHTGTLEFFRMRTSIQNLYLSQAVCQSLNTDRQQKKKKRKTLPDWSQSIFMLFTQSDKSWLFCTIMIKSSTDVASDYFMEQISAISVWDIHYSALIYLSISHWYTIFHCPFKGRSMKNP